jgi:hypothetical protein
LKRTPKKTALTQLCTTNPTYTVRGREEGAYDPFTKSYQCLLAISSLKMWAFSGMQISY